MSQWGSSLYILIRNLMTIITTPFKEILETRNPFKKITSARGILAKQEFNWEGWKKWNKSVN